MLIYPLDACHCTQTMQNDVPLSENTRGVKYHSMCLENTSDMTWLESHELFESSRCTCNFAFYAF